MEIIEDGKDIAVSVCPHCKKRVEITKSDWQEIKAQILAENPLAGLTNEELIYLKRLNEHVSNPVFSKFFVELFRRDKKGEID